MPMKHPKAPDFYNQAMTPVVKEASQDGQKTQFYDAETGEQLNVIDYVSIEIQEEGLVDDMLCEVVPAALSLYEQIQDVDNGEVCRLEDQQQNDESYSFIIAAVAY